MLLSEGETMDAEQKTAILAECKELMGKARYDEQKIDQFCGFVSDILQEIIDNPCEGREVTYKLKKRLDCVEFKISVSGDRIDPLNEGPGAENRRFQDAINHVLFNPETSIAIGYTPGWNHLTVKSPSKIANSKLLNEPMVQAMLLGAVAGVILRLIPQEISAVILDGMAAPLMATLINLLMGIIGPLFFLSIIVAICSLGSMDELTNVGKVIIKRFVIVGIWVAVLTTAVALVFFPVLGASDAGIDLPAVEGVLLGIIPTDFITPFTQGQIPQVILLGIISGAALLMMGEAGKPVREALTKAKEWVLAVMVLMMKVLPLLPFISTMMIVANGKAAVFLRGWKFIVAAYICYLLSIAIEFIAVSLRCKRSISDLWKMLKEIATMAFVTATPPVTMQMSYEVSEKEMGIDRSFTDLWLSLAFNLLSPARTISLVLSVFFIADMAGLTIDVAMLIVMVIMVVQLSLASTGAIPSTTVILETLRLPTDSIGLFSAFEVLTRNAGAAYDITYSMLEQLDAARETGKMKDA